MNKEELSSLLLDLRAIIEGFEPHTKQMEAVKQFDLKQIEMCIRALSLPESERDLTNEAILVYARSRRDGYQNRDTIHPKALLF
jgi:hypothetical protein